MDEPSSTSYDTVGSSTPLHVREDRRQLWSIARRAAAGVAVLVAVVALALNRPIARNAFLITLLSVGLAYVIAPLAERVRRPHRAYRKPLSPVMAVLVIYFVMLILGTTAWLLVAGKFQQQLTDLGDKLPTYVDRARQRLETIERITNRFSPPNPFADHLAGLWHTVSVSIKTNFIRVSAEVIACRPVLPWIWLVPIIALVLISRVGWFRQSAVAHLPEGHLRWRGEEFFHQVNSVLAGYTRAQILASVLIGITSMAGFWLIGLPQALFLGTISGALEFLPIAGPLSIAIVACGIVSGERLLVLIGFFVAMRLVQDYLIYPRLVGRGMHMHPVAIILAILAGAEAGGMFGALVAIPFVGIASIAVRHWREYWAIEKLLKEHARRLGSEESSD
ncbi:MAG TPA: AI-2E family transporter [Terriglobia bacterium]|nr:AI-2E family transporter [Terriglobia bacterium]